MFWRDRCFLTPLIFIAVFTRRAIFNFSCIVRTLFVLYQATLIRIVLLLYKTECIRYCTMMNLFKLIQKKMLPARRVVSNSNVPKDCIPCALMRCSLHLCEVVGQTLGLKLSSWMDMIHYVQHKQMTTPLLYSLSIIEQITDINRQKWKHHFW